jgi:hypothetical protein
LDCWIPDISSDKSQSWKPCDLASIIVPILFDFSPHTRVLFSQVVVSFNSVYRLQVFANMPELFVSYSHTDYKPVSNIALCLEMKGYQVWWDLRLRANQDFGMEIEAALKNANCAVVAWSNTARNSLWVRAEATVALESGKLVQLSLDGTKPPLPFTMIHLLDFSNWRGQIDDVSWHHLQDAVESVLRGNVSMAVAPKFATVRLSGFGPMAVVGGASLALVLIAAGLVGLGATGLYSANLFGAISSGMLSMAMLAFTYMVTRMISIYLASR